MDEKAIEAIVKETCAALKIPAAGQSYIDLSAKGPPRLVRSRAGNVSGRFPSRKGWRTRQFESHKLELPAAIQYEYDQHVVVYFDQPQPIRLTYAHLRFKHFSQLHTPDFLVVRTHEVALEEWKTEEELEELAKQMPNRYVRGEDGKWHCPPGEEYAAKYGMRYYIRSSKEINFNLHVNLSYLEDYYRPKVQLVDGMKVTLPLEADEQIAAALIEHVNHNQGVTVAELRRAVQEARKDQNDPIGRVANTINILIIQGRLYVDLLAERLTPEYQDRTHVFLNKEAARAYTFIPTRSPWDDTAPPSLVSLQIGCKLAWDKRSWTVVNRGQTEIWLQAENGHIAKFGYDMVEGLVREGHITPVSVASPRAMSATAERILAEADEKDLERANENFLLILPALLGQRLPKVDEVIARKRRRLLKAYREAELVHGCGYVGLVPQWGNCGSTPRRDTAVLQLMNEYAERYETPKGQTAKSVWNMLRSECEEKALVPPSYHGFCDFLAERPEYEQARKREGEKGAYDDEPVYWELETTTPRHGSTVFDTGHIDHTEAEIELIASEREDGIRAGQVIKLGRIWLTMLTDSFSRRILAVYLSYDKPSYRSNMMVARECVRRHGRLPRRIVMDQGKDFHSVYWDALLARHEITKKVRPKKPRFGSVIERLFGTANIQFFRNLRGNTHLMHDPRTVTPEVNPKNLAVWTLPELYPEIRKWAYEVYDQTMHPALGASPFEICLASIDSAGDREHVLVAYDAQFIRSTMPSTRKGTARVTEHKVKINYLFYMHSALYESGVECTDVPVRYDPFDLSVAYAFVNGRWVQLRSEHYLTFQGRTEKEIEIASEKIREQAKVFNKSASITAKRIGDFLRSVEGKEAVLIQRLKDREVRAAQRHLMSVDPVAEAATSATPADSGTQLDGASQGSAQQSSAGAQLAPADVSTDLPTVAPEAPGVAPAGAAMGNTPVPAPAPALVPVPVSGKPVVGGKTQPKTAYTKKSSGLRLLKER